ncbi:ISL3 family transposase [Myxosarcina sp. GI1]|uniref:ISL3 family transposase n=1 Tax=Myxosarcina sp. GI1 TaxID=1541065 RepID=UPI00056049CB|nr:ISL3 family transposase [Myxosarcina sp. GI1]
MDNSIQIPLDLPDVRVLEVSKTEEGTWLIRVESTLKGTSCRKCGKKLTHFHGFDQPIRLRHLPVFEQPVYVELKPKRYQCRSCQGKPTTTQRLSWHELRSPNTKPYEKWLLRFLVNSTVVDVANKLSLSEEIVTGVLDRWLTTKVNWDRFQRIEILGIDEIALKRRHRDYVVLVTTPLIEQGVEVLAVLADRKKETMVNFFASIPIRLRNTIERVCTDMYLGFVNAAREQLPRAHIIIDRFHVARAYRHCADLVRRQELKLLKQKLPQKEYKTIKGAMWAFRKSSEQLNDEEWELLQRLFSYSPKMKEAYILREELTEIFERLYNPKGAKCAIRAWCKRVRQSQISQFTSFLKTIETWLEQIANYFLERLTSSFVEGFNNRVKVLKRRCYGIFDVERLFQRLTLDIHGYERFGLT